VRNKSDHLERPAKKYQRISTDATPPNVGYGDVMTGATIGDDPRFLHKTTSDVDIIDLPGFSDKDINKMSKEEVDEHFNKPPLKGIDISDHLTTSQRTQMQRFLLKNRDMFALDPKRPGQVNATPMTINTGDAQLRAFPHQSTMPHIRPLVEEHIKSMLNTASYDMQSHRGQRQYY
jgi:hypothetical protein